MIKIQEFAAYIQGDDDNEIKDMLTTYIKTGNELMYKGKDRVGGIISYRSEAPIRMSTDSLTKEQYDFHIFILSPSNISFEVYAELIDSCYKNPRGTIVLIRKFQHGFRFTDLKNKEISKVVAMVNKICGRVACCLNDKYAILDLIFEQPLEVIQKSNWSDCTETIDKMYEVIKQRVPKEIFENQTKIQNIGRLVNKYIKNYGNNS